MVNVGKHYQAEKKRGGVVLATYPIAGGGQTATVTINGVVQPAVVTYANQPPVIAYPNTFQQDQPQVVIAQPATVVYGAAGVTSDMHQQQSATEQEMPPTYEKSYKT